MIPFLLIYSMSTCLNLGFWNIHGFKHKELGNKLKLQEVKNAIERHDIYGLVETHSTPESDLDMMSFKRYSKHRLKSGNKAHGGISLYVNKKVAKGVTLIKTGNENALWCKLDRKFFKIRKDIYLGTVYFSPQMYEKSKNEDRTLITKTHELSDEILFDFRFR